VSGKKLQDGKLSFGGSAVDSEGRTLWIVDAHRDDGKCYAVRSDEMLTAFLELESAIRCMSDQVLHEK
jgi:hypothetical protein